MPTNPEAFSQGGLPYPAANELVRQIDGETNTEALVQMGFAPPLAIELARQITARTGNVDALAYLNVNSVLATAIVSAINARGAE